MRFRRAHRARAADQRVLRACTSRRPGIVAQEEEHAELHTRAARGVEVRDRAPSVEMDASMDDEVLCHVGHPAPNGHPAVHGSAAAHAHAQHQHQHHGHAAAAAAEGGSLQHGLTAMAMVTQRQADALKPKPKGKALCICNKFPEAHPEHK